MKTAITCQTCNGTGRKPLPEHLQQTFAMLSRPKTATQMHELVPSISANSFSNRLSDLLALGLVKRDRAGKFLIYSRK